MPADFEPPITARLQRGAIVLAWRGRLQLGMEQHEAEIGVRAPKDSPEGVRKAAVAHLRELVWLAQDLARLGHAEGLKVAMVKRHEGHPVSVPQLDLPPEEGEA